MNDDPTAVLADEQFEQVVLGAMMQSPAATEVCLETLKASDFYTAKHQLVFDAIRAQHALTEPTDPKAVAYRLQADGLLATVGADYLHTLVSSVPIAAQAGWYAERVTEFSTRRAIVAACTKAVQAARNTGVDVPEVVNHVQAIVHSATTRRDTGSTVTFTDILDQTLAEVFDPEGPARGLSTGVGSLDDVIGGLKPGQLVVVAGRPGMGKSVLVNDMVRAASIRQLEPSLLFNLEMSAGEVQRRILAAEAGVNLRRIINGPLHDFEKPKLREAAEKLRGVFIHIDDTATISLADIRSTARKLQADVGLGLIVVDYLQLMTSAVHSDNRAQEVGAISRGLKILARELEVPVVAAAQLNRMAEQRSDRRPQLADLRESGSIEQDSDVVILLHRFDYHEPEHERAGEIDLIIAKNRNGPIETVTAAAQLHFSRIVDFDTPPEAS